LNKTPTEHWASRSYRRINDYTLMRSPVWLQEHAVALFRSAMLRRIAAAKPQRQPFQRVLDLGCGVGDWTLGYLSFARRVVGVDVNASFLAAARGRAAAELRGVDAEFVQYPLQAWDDFDGVDLVALGAVLMYLDDTEARALVARVADRLQGCAMLYVRSTVVTRLRRPYATPFGFYRTSEWYEALFAHAGFRVIDTASSAVVVAERVARAVRAPAWTSSVVAESERAERTLRRENDFMNWVLLRAA
jgi:predicted TPR repeat methyltransferase